MNITESQTLYDLLQVLYDRSFLVSTPKNYFPIVSELAEQLFTNKILRPDIIVIKDSGKHEREINKDLQKKLFFNIQSSLFELEKFKDICPNIEILLQKHQNLTNNNPLDWELIFNIDEEITAFFTSINENILPSTTKDYPIDVIVKFMEKYIQLWKYTALSITRMEKTSLFYSLYFIEKVRRFYNINTRYDHLERLIQNNKHHAANHFYSDIKDFDVTLELSNSYDAAQLGFDVEEYKIHVSRVWNFIGPKLLQKINTISQLNGQSQAFDRFYYRYSEKDGFRSGIITGKNNPQEHTYLEGDSAAVFNILLKNSDIAKDELADRVGIEPESARNAIRTINNKLSKYFPNKIVVKNKQKRGSWLINPEYKDLITHKK